MGNTMKKLFLLIAFGTTLVFSQDASKWSLYGGISSMNTNLEENTTNLLGTNLGFGYRFTDKLTIGMGFSQRGFTGIYEYDDSFCYLDEFQNRVCFEKTNGRYSQHQVSTRYEGIEFWMSYTLFNNDNFSLWTGPVYSVLNELTEEVQADDFTESFSQEIEESDFGLMIGATLPIKNKLGMNIGYYHSLDEMEFNNVFIELNLFL